MTRYLNSAYIRDHRARVSHRRGALVVSTPDGKQRIPLEAVDALIILGGAQITAQALDACVKRGVQVSSLRMSGAIRFLVGRPTSGNVHLRSAQYRVVGDESRSMKIAKSIIAAKIQSSSKVVNRWARDENDPHLKARLESRSVQIRERIARLASADTADHVRGIEGDAARIYFRAIRQVLADCELKFSGRNRRPPRDPVNALLSFCYSMLVTECVGAAESVGLDFQLGLFHRPRAGRPSLALDISEELRALTDRFVVTLIRRSQIRPADFDPTPGGAVYLNDEGRKRLIKLWEEHKASMLPHKLLDRDVERWALPSIQATLLARHLRGDLPAYPPFVLN